MESLNQINPEDLSSLLDNVHLYLVKIREQNQNESTAVEDGVQESVESNPAACLLLEELLLAAEKDSTPKDFTAHLIQKYQFRESKSEIVTQIVDWFRQNHDLLITEKDSKPMAYRYRTLHWRVGARIASRSIYSDLRPVVTLQFNVAAPEAAAAADAGDVKDGDVEKRQQMWLQSDPANLFRLRDVLKQAISTAHADKKFKSIHKTF